MHSHGLSKSEQSLQDDYSRYRAKKNLRPKKRDFRQDAEVSLNFPSFLFAARLTYDLVGKPRPLGMLRALLQLHNRLTFHLRTWILYGTLEFSLPTSPAPEILRFRPSLR